MELYWATGDGGGGGVGGVWAVSICPPLLEALKARKCMGGGGGERWGVGALVSGVPAWV